VALPRRLRLIAVSACVVAAAVAFGVYSLLGASASSAGSTGHVLSTTSTKWRVQRPLRFVPYQYHGASCAKGTKTCWVTGGSFNPTPEIVKTENGGGSWSLLPSSAINLTQGGVSAVSCPSATHCVGVGGQMGLAQHATVASAVFTTNGGSSWTKASMPYAAFSDNETVLRGVSCPTTSQCVAVGSGGILVTSSNGGSTWTGRKSGTTETLRGVSCPTTSDCHAVGDGGTVIASTNGGKTWSAQTSGTSEGLNGVACPTATTCFAVGSSGTVIATTDGGATWNPQTSPTPNNLNGVSCPSASTCFAVGDAGTVIATTDGGTTWTAQSPGTQADLNAVACYSASGCVVGSSQRTSSGSESPTPGGADVLYTTNGGATWITKEPRPPIRRLGTGVRGSGDPISCPGPSNCFAVGASGPTNGGSGGNVILKTSDGVHWSFVHKGRAGSGALHGISCASGSHCIATGYSFDHAKGVILATTNGGKTWTPQTSGVVGRLWGVSCPTTSTCFTVGDNGEILRTHNGGKTWTAQTSGTSLSLYGVSCADTLHCVVTGVNGAILTTTDGGSTWVPRTGAMTSTVYGISCHDVKHCVAVGATFTPSSATIVGIEYTSNGGATWKTPFIVVPTNQVWDLYGVSCTSNSDCTASGGTGFYAPGHPALLLSTTDGGKQWARNKPPAGTHGTPGVACTGKGCWATGWGGLIVSSFHR
jgi:photosystem II stability/assembly factor-like uncharacterized protein